jgi:[ribosomal protein S5]-alanine N-acetyltransferase
MSTCFPDLETDRLLLRNVMEEDEEFILRLYSNKKVCEYLYDEEIYETIDDARDFIRYNSNPEENGNNRWCLIRKGNNESIGTCGYDSWDTVNNIAEIGYDLHVDYWGQGYMKEGLNAAIQNGFDNMKLNRINGYVALGNEKSIKLLESLGFKNEGIYREKHLFRGNYYDHFSFSLLKKEWT